MSVTDYLAIIGAITVTVTAIISAVASAIVTVRTSSIKKTVESTHDLVNGNSQADKTLLEDYRQAMQSSGVEIPRTGNGGG
jgi:hypothetical protein